MLIIPIGKKPDWRRPPWATLLLVLVNCIVFFGWQVPDQEAEERARAYYFEQKLDEIEFPRFEAWLQQR